jgi:hypothetical protein
MCWRESEISNEMFARGGQLEKSRWCLPSTRLLLTATGRSFGMKKCARPILAAILLFGAGFPGISSISIATPPTQTAASIERTPVTSRAIASVGYDPAGRTLEVVFCKGQVRRYFEVPPDVYHDFLAAKSKGRFYNKTIRRHFKSVKPQAPPAR